MNASEQLVKDELERRGFICYRNGWPDFLAIRKTQRGAAECLGVMGVEVKTNGDKLSEAQQIIHRILRQARIPIHIVSPLTVKDLRPSSRSLLTQGDVSDARAAAKRIAQEIDRLQDQIDTLNKIVEGTHYHLESIGPLLTIENFWRGDQ